MNLLKLPALFFVRTVKPFRSEKSDVIIALAFGQRDNPADDVVNIALARVVEQEQARTHLPVIAQWEIGDQLKIPSTIVREHREQGKYIDTREVLIQAFAQGNKNAIIVAHPDHVWRVIATAKKLGFKVTGVADTQHVPYDPLSKQAWTRSADVFLPYERMARIKYLKLGFI